MAQLLEHTLCEAQPGSIDREAGTIKRVKVLGRTSKRGRIYSDGALNDAVKLYEGMRLNLDHPPEDRPGMVRPFLEQIGQLRGCHIGTDGVYAALDYLKTHPAAPVLLECAERFPHLLGLSHNAESASERREGGKRIIESLKQVRSVDIVTRPATTNGLFESESEDDPMPKTMKQILESAPAGDHKTRLTKLLEMDGDMGGMPVEAASDATPEEAIKSALKQAGHAIVDKIIDGDLDKVEGLKKLKELLGMAEKASGDGGGTTPPGDSAASESVAKELADLKRQLTESQQRQTAADCKNALLESGREAKAEWIKALSAVPEADRKPLLESLPLPVNKGGVKRPATSPSILESDDTGKLPATAEEFARRHRAG